jgi:penicillin-binding protein 1A
MGRDDARAVPGLQGGTAPARAFAAYMRHAVKDRPVEQFDTDLELPEWQLEPDDEVLFGDPDEYYFMDEDGNLVPPPGPDERRGMPFPPDDPVLPQRRPEQGSQPAAPAPPAASDDFLERATGGVVSPEQGARRRALPGPAVAPGGVQP